MANSRPILLVSYPRSASNLLVQVLSLDKQPNVSDQKRGYHLRAVSDFPRRNDLWENSITEWEESERKQLRQVAKEGFEALEATRSSAAAEGKIVFIKEHVDYLTDPIAFDKYIFGKDKPAGEPWRLDDAATTEAAGQYAAPNDTMLSTDYLRQWNAVFIIRHPAKAFPSLYRVFVDVYPNFERDKAAGNFFPAFMTLRWNRNLYDLLTEIHAKDGDTPGWPVIVDADDVMAQSGVMPKLASMMGLDPSKVSSAWTPPTAEEVDNMEPIQQRMFSTLNESKGIETDKSAASLDITAEVAKWREEFGDEGAEKLEKWVRDAMPEYEYLKEKRLKP